MGAPFAPTPDAFLRLPGAEAILNKVLGEKKLVYGRNQRADSTDERNARLLVGAIARHKSLFTILPDEMPHRPAFLLGCVLLSMWAKHRRIPNRQNAPSILYFGTKTGIRQQLREVSLAGMSWHLDSVFQQTNIGRSGEASSATNTVSQDALPKVYTIYSPVSVKELLQSYRPDLVAVDLSDSPHVDWLKDLITSASSYAIPVVAWGTNPLSTSIFDSGMSRNTFVWPATEFFQKDCYPNSLVRREVQSIELVGQTVDEVGALFKRVYGLLIRCHKGSQSDLDRRAIATHWGYLRALESMSVPCDLYEAEAKNFWGLKSLNKMQFMTERFREAASSSIAGDLETVAALLTNIQEIIYQNPPIWAALINMCVEAPSQQEKTITFTARSRKQMFLFALLAKHNIAESDLNEIGINIVSFDEVARGGATENTLATLPSPALVPKLLPYLTSSSCKFLVYPHQVTPLRRRIAAIDQQLFSNTADVSGIFNNLGAEAPKDLFCFSRILNEVSSSSMTIGGSTPTRTASGVRNLKNLMKETAAVEELTKLFGQEDQDKLDESDPDSNTEPEIRENYADSEDDFVQSIVAVTFVERVRIAFAEDYQVQLIDSSGVKPELKQRFVKSLRPGDRIVYLPGQRRQSLYELIVDRVHKHPAFAVHLAMIRRWQDELRLAYLSRQPRMTADAILLSLAELGSNITTELSVHNWINGYVLCPDDPEDLNRLGKILNLPFVTTNYKYIYKAAARIRGIHIGLALRLSSWLSRACVESDVDSEVFDSDLGLTFGDFRHSLLVLTVRSQCIERGIFLRSQLGAVEQA